MKKYAPRKVNALSSGVRSDRSDPGNGQVFAKTRPSEPLGSTRTLLPAEFLHTLGEFVQGTEFYFAGPSGESPTPGARTLSATANAFPKRTHSANALPSNLRLGFDWLAAKPSANAFPSRHLPGSRRPAPTFHNNADDSISCKGSVTTLGESVYLTGKRKCVGRMLAGDAAST